MNSRFLCYSGALAALLTTSLGSAQEPLRITEADVVTAAVLSNPTLHVALLRAQQSRYNLRAEEALYTPVFDANAGYTHSRVPSLVGPITDAMGMQLTPAGTRITGSDVVDVGAGITKPLAYGTLLSASVAGQRSSRASLEQQALLGASGPGYSLVGRLAASQPLLRGAGTELGLASLRQAKLNLTANQLAAQAAASGLLSQVVSAYWELWYAAEAVRIDQASRDLARVQQEQANQQVQSGALAPALPSGT